MLLKGIFWTNNKKHGIIRGTLGGYLMYPSIILFFLFQVLFLRLLKKVLVVFNIPPLNRKDFVDYGRINLVDYSWFDRLNCHFCAYANGTTHMVATSLAFIGKCNINSLDESKKEEAERILAKTFFWAKPVGFIGLGFVIAFEKLLGYQRADLNAIKDTLKNNNYGKDLKQEEFLSVYQNAFKLSILFKSFQIFLSIIESNWCPLTYAIKKFLLEHQKNFISTGYEDVVSYINKSKKYEILSAETGNIDHASPQNCNQS